MPKYLFLDFDPTDTQDQYAIVHPNYYGDGDPFIEWFDTDELRAIRLEKYQGEGFTIIKEKANVIR